MIQGKGGGTREQRTYRVKVIPNRRRYCQVAGLSVHQVATRVMALQEDAFAGHCRCFHGGSIITS
jgi:hypothetical protein